MPIALLAHLILPVATLIPYLNISYLALVASERRDAPLRRKQDHPTQTRPVVRKSNPIDAAIYLADQKYYRGDGACGKTSLLNVFTRGWVRIAITLEVIH